MERISRSDALRKCIVMFEALRRLTGKGNAGLEPAAGAEESYEMNCQVLEQLREMLREMEAGEQKADSVAAKGTADWQMEIMAAGRPPERMIL